jgi:seryl-tRNA synthetase
MEVEASATSPQRRIHDALVSNGIVWPMDAKGVLGYSETFEDVICRFNRLIDGKATRDGAQTRVFPPILSREVLRRQGYLESFPHLCGSVFNFSGNELQAKETARRAATDPSANEFHTMTDVALTPAVCYPLYQTLGRAAPAKGQLFSLLGWAYRHEPSEDPTRMRSFRMRELVYVGVPDNAREWRDAWLQHSAGLFSALGLEFRIENASDPFFGRSGRLLASNQAELGLKQEILVPIISAERPTAVFSANLHTEHFTSKWQIRLEGGGIAHTSCVAFGLERVAIALFAAYGTEPREWPGAVRKLLWPEP